MKINKLTRKEILTWIKNNVSEEAVVDLDITTLLQGFQKAVANKNLTPKEVVSSIKCLRCGTVHKANNIELLELERYVPPRGCTDGDYWEHEEFFIRCEKCGFALTIPKDVRYKLPLMSSKLVARERYMFHRHSLSKIKYKKIYV